MYTHLPVFRGENTPQNGKKLFSEITLLFGKVLSREEKNGHASLKKATSLYTAHSIIQLQIETPTEIAAAATNCNEKATNNMKGNCCLKHAIYAPAIDGRGSKNPFLLPSFLQQVFYWADR